MTPNPNVSQTIARAVLAALLTGVGLWTLWEFVPALAWAGIIAIGIWPLYRAAERHCPPGKHNMLLPSAFTALVAAVFIVPLAMAAVQVAREWHLIVHWLESARQSGLPAPDWLHHLPFGTDAAVEWWNENLSDKDSAADLLRRIDRAELLGTGRLIGAGLIHRAILFGFSLLTLFFLFKDGDRLIVQMRHASARAFGPSGERVGRQVIASVLGTVNGLVLVGVAEGVLMGIVYALAHVPHPALFGAVTAVAAMIPFGAPLVFGVAAILLVAQGLNTAAIVVFAAGIAVTFVADHFVRPVLIGGATKLPFLWVLFGILGGVASWGLLGLFLGPAVMAALIMLWREWTEGATK
ncbi:MAG: AI-2E family transporter [Rhodospirillales bacterium]